MKKALALFSGGLDSMISMKLLKDQGIEVIALHFNIGFGGNRDKLEYLKNATAQVGVELQVCDIRKQFFDEVLFEPKYGYGRFFNPCIDCHANMFKNAFYKLLELKADFVISGEVIGQRPKSQRREALDQVRKLVREIGSDSAFDTILSRDTEDSSKPKYLDELVLRPMSAKLLEPTFPEKALWVDREKLLDVSGRGRSTQLEMLKNFGWKYYENPGGGCLLTDTSVSLKLKDLSSHRKMVIEDSAMVKVGRYLVLKDGARCVIARNEDENHKIAAPHPLMDKIELLECNGPVGLVESQASDADKVLAGRIVLGYGKSQKNQSYRVRIGEKELALEPYDREEAREFLFLK
ncbi:argininosuccinate synthase domain-containing protein [Helicobacter sp. 11S02596-1]|uniref:argininosuccinate synthase domain-containing protein n=1 Tax=Helicobacter sp. 11S02596-1 TaxID=1476194 RepID=UPI000BA57BB1|nr:argininosuccinate synthase domain-containing protein [Helicobacter sp. 11S02596-1]PAF45224.1 ATP-binding protein [Helicobacter sp. 11S02596-1]